MRKLVSVVFTIERNIDSGRQCIKHLKQNGFVDPILKIYSAAPKGSSVWKLGQSIMKNHFNVIRWFVDTYDANTHDLMVCEDDCEFVEPNVAHLVHEQLKILETHYNWSFCLLGQIAFGPLFEINRERSRLCRTTCPVAAHCYVLNGSKLNAYLRWIRPRWWTLPWMTEGWLLVPPGEKFAIFPSVATQNRYIKGMQKIPFLRNIPVIRFIRATEHFMYNLPFIVLLVVLILLLWKYTCSYKQST